MIMNRDVVQKRIIFSYLGKSYMKRSSLEMLSRGSYSDYYDNSFDPRITNEFAAAAFRIGHSWVNQELKTYKDNLK